MAEYSDSTVGSEERYCKGQYGAVQHAFGVEQVGRTGNSSDQIRGMGAAGWA